MIRVRFTADDLARTRLRTTGGPFTETVLGLAVLKSRRDPLMFDGWRARTEPRLDSRAADLARLLHPCPGLTIDVMTMAGCADTFSAAREELLSTATWANELAPYGDALQPPDWLRGFADGERVARRRFADALSHCYDHAVAPHWRTIRTHLESERSRLGRIWSADGVEGLLRSLRPRARWRSPYLELPDAGKWSDAPLDAHLDGRGLDIVPSVFFRGGPVPYFPIDRSRPAVLLCPALSDPIVGATLWCKPNANGHALADLLGRTRAAALTSIADHAFGCNTSELADVLDMSSATASQHASVLRSAGLVVSSRHRNMVVHQVTPLGAELLRQTATTPNVPNSYYAGDD